MGKNKNPDQDIKHCDTCSKLQITFGKSKVIQTQDSIILQVGGYNSITLCSHPQ